MSLIITGIGTATPQAISQAEAADISKKYCCETAQQERLFTALFRRSGVRTRRSVVLEASEGPLQARQSFFPPFQGGDDRGPGTEARMQRYEQEAAPLAIAAAQNALAESGIAARRITHLITVSCSGFYAPSFDVTLIKQLSLSPDVARTHVGFMGCHGAFNALRVARAFLESDPNACVLICALELCSLHYSYGWNPERIVANALFSDGAAALVAVGAEHASAGSQGWALQANGSHLMPESEEAMTWRIGDHGFQMTLSPQIPDLIRTHLRPWLEEWLAGYGLTIPAIGTWACHPGGPRILSACSDAVRLEPEVLAVSQQVLAEFGNMSSPTILFILQRLRERKASLPCVALGFGPGLAVESLLLTHAGDY